MQLILHPIRWWNDTPQSEKAPILMRLLVGGYMMYSGIQRFILGMGDLADAFYFLPIPPGWFWAIVGTVGQILCGAALFFGVMTVSATRYTILGLLVLLIWLPQVSLQNLFGSMYLEVILLLFAVLVSLMLTGPGALSMQKRVLEDTGS